MPDKPTCKSCAFFFQENGEHKTYQKGNCRRYAPRPVTRHQVENWKLWTEDNNTRWPIVYEMWWCGEWESVPEQYAVFP